VQSSILTPSKGRIELVFRISNVGELLIKRHARASGHPDGVSFPGFPLPRERRGLYLH